MCRTKSEDFILQRRITVTGSLIETNFYFRKNTLITLFNNNTHQLCDEYGE